ncbi:MAG: DNA/RNA non-specific endonuclease [Paludibacteraceae bacterium]|nr:DNA/RNA non-specific endonuclease [Paludibacteraceae bacterium]
MRNIRILILFSFSFTLCFAQKVDTVIVMPIYKSYFSYQTRTPLFVAYYLYNGGGDCSRKGITFKTGGLKYSSTKKDYKSSGYEIGHMTPSQDFAFDCSKDSMTFFFWNALPQTRTLNRGSWETLERKIRLLSKNNHLLIICGGFSFEKKIGNTSVPNYCWKIVKNLDTKEIKVYLFPNDNSDRVTEVSLSDLLTKLPSVSVQISMLCK